MKAVNLIPPDQRRSGQSIFSQASPFTLGLLAALAAALLVVAALVATGNQIDSRKAELATVDAQTAATKRQTAALKPYADVAALRERSATTIRTLAASRFDWPRLLDELSRHVPADVKIVTLDGSPSSIKIAGCTTSHPAVAHLMDRLRGVPGVTGVTLGTSTIVGGGGTDCPLDDTFDLTLAVSAVAVPEATTEPTSGSTTG